MNTVVQVDLPILYLPRVAQTDEREQQRVVLLVELEEARVDSAFEEVPLIYDQLTQLFLRHGIRVVVRLVASSRAGGLLGDLHQLLQGADELFLSAEIEVEARRIRELALVRLRNFLGKAVEEGP